LNIAMSRSSKDRETNERILEIEVRGKRGVGYCQEYAERGSTLRLRKRNNAHRTSVEMIEKFCASHIKNQLSTADINVKRVPRRTKLTPRRKCPRRQSHRI